MTIRIVIAIFPGVTHLDFTGPHQFFCRIPEAEVIVASPGGEDITADGLVFSHLKALTTLESCDVLCVPGGFGVTEMIHQRVFMDAIRRLSSSARFVTSVCTGSIILAATGLLDGKQAACHWAWRDLLAAFPKVQVSDQRVVRDGNVFTGGGVTAGIDMALTVIAELSGDAIAQRIQLGLEYAPQPPFNCGRPELAGAEMVTELRDLLHRTGDHEKRVKEFLGAGLLEA